MTLRTNAAPLAGLVVSIGKKRPVPSPVFDAFWRFAVERQQIYFRRVKGAAPPWTTDEVMQSFRFTNAYRAADRVSQYLIRNVIYTGDPSAEEVVFRVLLFKIFNRIATWELLASGVSDLSARTFDRQRIDAVLERALQRNVRIYSAAYIIPPAPYGEARKHQNHLVLLERMLRDRLPARIAVAQTMQHVYALLRGYGGIGKFLAYQFATDLNYSELTGFSEMSFVAAGPGARDGIRKCFRDCGGWSDEDVIRWVADHQELKFTSRGLDFPSLWGRRLQLIDVQNLFCEISKYSRVAFPDISGTTGRTKIKQRYHPEARALAPWFPPKWGLNHLIATVGAGDGL
jgi:hypothetical protein